MCGKVNRLFRRRRSSSAVSLMKSQASRVRRVSGTTSMAENSAERAMVMFDWPVQYQWWPVPTMPLPRKRMASR